MDKNPEILDPRNLAEPQKDLFERLLKQQESSLVYAEAMHRNQKEWMEAVLNEQRAQTAKLASINQVVTLWGVLMILGIIFGLCSIMFGL